MKASDAAPTTIGVVNIDGYVYGSSMIVNGLLVYLHGLGRNLQAILTIDLKTARIVSKVPLNLPSDYFTGTVCGFN